MGPEDCASHLFQQDWEISAGKEGWPGKCLQPGEELNLRVARTDRERVRQSGAALQTRQSGHEWYAGKQTCDRQALAGETGWLEFVARVKS